MNDQQIEQEIQDKGLTAPRVTIDDLRANIASEYYFTAADGVDGADIGALRERAVDNDLVISAVSRCVSKDGTPMASLSLLTFCVLILKNGFAITGESACASPENFDAEIGRKIARQNAVQKVWPLLGYALKNKLAGQSEQ